MKKFLSKIMYLYDYMFYRIATSWVYGKLYKKYRFSYYSSAIVSITQFFIFFDIISTIILSNFTPIELQPSRRIVASIFGLLAVIHIQLNHRRYKNKYDEFDSRWSNLDEKTKDKLDIIVFLMAILPLIYLPVLTNLFDFTK